MAGCGGAPGGCRGGRQAGGGEAPAKAPMPRRRQSAPSAALRGELVLRRRKGRKLPAFPPQPRRWPRRCPAAPATALLLGGQQPRQPRPGEPPPPPPPTFVKAPGRIVAIGDLHGDLAKGVACLEAAGVLAQDGGRRPAWVGGDTVVVQLGDILDKGDHEIGLLLLLREMDRQARLVGGAVYMLNGNHEVQNAAGDFRYVTEGGFLEAAKVAGLRGDALQCGPRRREARLRLYGPGGIVATELAKNPTVLVVNDTLFAHGGVMPTHVRYGLERLNAETADWFRGNIDGEGCRRGVPLAAMGTPEAVMRNRIWGTEQWGDPYARFQACSQLHATLGLLRARHMVIGHTPQLGGANCECDGRVWRIDVGVSRGVLNAVPQVLEIQPANALGVTLVKVLQPPGSLVALRRPPLVDRPHSMRGLWDE